MTKRLQSKYKISRRLMVNLWGRDKDPFIKRNYIPGQHGPTGRRRMPSDYGTQLSAKQKLKGYYANLNERQFRRMFEEAGRRKGDTGALFIGLLEQRLDMVVYRMNFVPTVFAARQFVNHKHVMVNGKIVNIGSYRLKPGDVVQVRDRAHNIPMVIEAIQNAERPVPDYLQVDTKALKGTFLRVPDMDEVPFPFVPDINLVIEYYNR